MEMSIPPLTIKIMFESNPLTSRILVRTLAVSTLQSRASGLQSTTQGTPSGPKYSSESKTSKHGQSAN